MMNSRAASRRAFQVSPKRSTCSDGLTTVVHTLQWKGKHSFGPRKLGNETTIVVSSFSQFHCLFVSLLSGFVLFLDSDRMFQTATALELATMANLQLPSAIKE